MKAILRITIGPIRSASSAESGQVLVLFAACLVGICGLVGMSIDVGNMVFTAADVQKVADASALAASQDLPSTSAATSTANTYNENNGGGSLVVAFTEDNTVVRVTATKHVDFTFLRVLGLSGRDITKTAAARGKPITVTGYNWVDTAPFIIWGGSRQNEVHAGDTACALHTCVGKSYTFMDTNWMNASGKPKLPDWNSSDSNNFKGDIQHGDGAPVNHVGETFSVGGLGSVVTPTPGSILVIPIVDRAGGNSDQRTFRVAAWAIVKVDSNCSKSHCTGTILNPNTTTPPSGWVGGGSTPPPPSITYTGRDSGLID